MSRRRKRSLEELDDLLPNELIETTSGSTVIELKAIVSQLEKQVKEMIEKYEDQIDLLADRLESIESDFIQVVEALSPSGSGMIPTRPSPTAPSSATGPQTPAASSGGPKPPSLG